MVMNVIDVQTDTHYAVLSLLMLLANSPTNAQYHQSTASRLPGSFSFHILSTVSTH